MPPSVAEVFEPVNFLETGPLVHGDRPAVECSYCEGIALCSERRRGEMQAGAQERVTQATAGQVGPQSQADLGREPGELHHGMPATEELPLAEQRELRDQCTVFLAGHGPVTAAGLLAGIPADTVTDRYGSGGVVAELEIEVGGLLGKPAAVVLPSGTMAQQSVLRVHADRRQRRTVIFHPMCHLHRHEWEAYQRLHGLTGRPAGELDCLMTIGDLTSIAGPATFLSSWNA